MRDVLNLNPINFDPNDITVICFDKLPDYDKTDYDLNIPKEYESFILDVKRDCHGSFEYSQYMRFLKDNLDMNKCSFFKNISGENSKRIKIEIHHDPFTIEDIIRIVVRKRLAYLEMMEPEQVSKEVMFLHYNMMVGLIPLSTTVHQLVGNNYLFVPTTHVMGNYKAFVQAYDEFIDPETKAILNRIEEATLVYDESRAQRLLERHYIYIDVGGDEYDLPPYEVIIQMMKDKINEINQKAIEKSSSSSSKLESPFIRLQERQPDSTIIDLL